MKTKDISYICRLALLLVILLFDTGVVHAQLTLSSSNMTGDYSNPVSITMIPGFGTQGAFYAYISGTPGGGDPDPSPLVNQNYIHTYTYLSPVTSPPANPLPEEAVQQVSYFDGLSRPVQNVLVKATPAKDKDVVIPLAYDALGRGDKQYLPYATAAGIGGIFKTGAVSAQAGYYATPPSGSGVTAIPAIGGITPAYNQSVYENSPLDRISEQGFAGSTWHPYHSSITGSGHTVQAFYTSNNTDSYGTLATTRKVARYGVTLGTDNVPDLTLDMHYGVGQLQVAIVADENQSGDAGTFAGRLHTSETYSDKEGLLILQRTFNEKDGVGEMLSTYYIYDDYGNLTYVLPPGSEPDRSELPIDKTEWLNRFAYQYRYDDRNRMSHRRLPGTDGWENFIYDGLGQLVLSQDSRQQVETDVAFSPGPYRTFHKYDVHGRLVMKGIERNSTAPYEDLVYALATSSVQWEERSTASGNLYGYTNQVIPNTVNNLDVLEVNYYDDYTGIPDLPHNQSASYSSMTKGLLVATKEKVLGTDTYLWTVLYYDTYGRVVRQYKQHYQGGASGITKFDDVTNAYNFSGQLTSSTRSHHTSSSVTPALTVITTYSYDHMGRLVDTKKKIDSHEVIQSRLIYNELGQLKEKKLHSENGGLNFISVIGYSYNERGWLTKIASPHFTEELAYNSPIGSGIPQYNGNISQLRWGHAATVSDTSNYSYDKLNRLLSGVKTGTVMSEVMTYDNMGNITKMTRDGIATNYAYTGNRLTALSGGLTGSYTYDANGNATVDRTGMAFSYNHLNLPKTATKSGTSVSYIYDALGNMFRKTATVGGTSTERDYVAGIEYSKVGSAASTIEMIHTEEGYLQKNGGTYTYHYNLTDHLGNIRSTLQRTAATTGTVIQKHDYYPFGKAKALVTSGINKYLYNGKELQIEIGGQYDYGARFYDAEIGRWNVVDPLAEKYVGFSPYIYGGNDPVYYIDPDGMDIIQHSWGTQYTGIDAQNAFRSFQMQYSPTYDTYGVMLPNVDVYANRLTSQMTYDIMQSSYDAFWGGTSYTRYIAPTHRHLFGPNPYRPFAGPQTAQEWELAGDIMGASEIPGLAQVGDAISLASNVYQGNWGGTAMALAAFAPGGSQMKLAAKTGSIIKQTSKKADYLFTNRSDAMNWARKQLGHNTDKMYDVNGKWIGWSNSKGSVYWGHGDWGKGVGSSTFPHLNYNIGGTKGHLFLQDKITNRGMWGDFSKYFGF